MPPRHKETRVEKELRKSLDTANKIIQEQQPKIGDLETKVASKNEQIAALQAQAGECDKLREICKQLGCEILEQKAALKEEKENQGKYREILKEAIRNTTRDYRKLEIDNLFLKETCQGLERQNAAIRAALKEVL